MVKKIRITLTMAALLLGMTGLLSSNAQAQVTKTFFAAGSSAMYQSFALAAGMNNADGLGDPAWCGTFHWTFNSGANVVDSRNSSILPEPGNIWVVWDNSTSPTCVMFYVSVDSIVGVREFFAGATVNVLEAANTAGQNKIKYFPAGSDTPLPTAVLAAIQGQEINVAMTDIRPEDAYFATLRALTSPAGTKIPESPYTGVGYAGSVPGVGTPIYSSQSATQANPVDFNMYGNDPFTGASPRKFNVDLVGANPVVVIANVTSTGAGHLGDGNYTNINRSILQNILTGQVTRIADILDAPQGSEDTVQPIHVFQREPLSGTFNTMEFCIPLAREFYYSFNGPVFTVGCGVTATIGQETCVNPTNTACLGHTPCSAESGNPFYHITTSPGDAGATRGRVVGTGEMVSTVNSTADGFGYAFWSYANFNGDNTNLRYLTVDGVDPFYAASNLNPKGVGQLPQCTSLGGSSGPAQGCAVLPFPNIVNGSYPIWSYQRLIYDPTVSTLNPTEMLNYVHAIATNTVSDFTDVTKMGVFRSHFYQIFDDASDSQFPNNGIKTGVPETGGDMGGQVLSIQSELDYITDTAGQTINGLVCGTGCQQTELFQ